MKLPIIKPGLLIVMVFIMSVSAAAAKQTVVVGLDRSYAPYAFLDSHRRPSGFEADLIQKIAQRSGWIIEYRIDTWSKINDDFDNGKIDLLTGYVRTEERASKYVFSNPHTYVQYSTFQRRGSEVIKEWSNLAGKELLIETDDIVQEELKSKKIQSNTIFVNDYTQALNMLSQGQGSVSIMPKILGNNYIAANQLNNIACTSTLDFAYPYCMATTREKSYLIYTINLVLNEMELDGTLSILRKKWFVSDPIASSRKLIGKKSVMLFLGALIMLAMIIGFFLLFYRRLLAKQTAYLQEQIREKEDINLELNIVQSLYSGGPVIFMKWHDIEKEMFKFISLNIKVFGYSADDFINGAIHYRDIIHPEDLGNILTDRTSHLENNECSYQQEYRILCPSDQINTSDSPTYHLLKLQNPILEKAQSLKVCWVKDHTVVIPANEYEPRSFQGYIFDITHLHERNTDLHANRLIAESADQSKDLFLASITDEIRKPIESLKNTIVKYSKTKPSDEQNEALIKLFSSTHRLEYIIKQIRSYIDYMKGDMLPANTWLDLYNTIDALVPDMQVRCATKNLHFTANFPQNGIKVFLSRQYIEDTITIIFENAIKFTSSGSIVLNVSYEPSTMIDGILNITICDDGEGIPPSRLEYLYQPFTQIDSSYTRVHGGLGLGLATLKQIAALTGAQIRICNREPNGTELSITWNVPYRN